MWECVRTESPLRFYSRLRFMLSESLDCVVMMTMMPRAIAQTTLPYCQFVVSLSRDTSFSFEFVSLLNWFKFLKIDLTYSSKIVQKIFLKEISSTLYVVRFFAYIFFFFLSFVLFVTALCMYVCECVCFFISLSLNRSALYFSFICLAMYINVFSSLFYFFIIVLCCFVCLKNKILNSVLFPF